MRTFCFYYLYVLVRMHIFVIAIYILTVCMHISLPLFIYFIAAQIHGGGVQLLRRLWPHRDRECAGCLARWLRLRLRLRLLVLGG